MLGNSAKHPIPNEITSVNQVIVIETAASLNVCLRRLLSCSLGFVRRHVDSIIKTLSTPIAKIKKNNFLINKFIIFKKIQFTKNNKRH